MERASPIVRALPTILNVNDRESNRYVVSKMLRNAGCRVLDATTGEEAVAIAEREIPDVVVLDIQLPDIDGMEVCRRLKANPATSSTLVLHTSATFVSIQDKVRGLDVGGDAFLVQPFTSEELIASVRALLRRKGVEEFQRRRAEEFAEADRRKDDFLAMLGHELRNPLNAIVMSQALIDQHPAPTDAEERARAVIRRQTAHLSRLVNDLVDVSRVTRGKIVLDRQLFDLVELLRQVASVAEQTTLKGCGQTLVTSLPAYPVPVEADRARLEQVFTNLIDNASKYSPDGTEIYLELEVDVAAGGGAHAIVTVMDHGRGIPREQINQVFNLFYQGQPTEARIGTGLGVGLTLVRSLVEAHGGAVAVHSEGEGKGSQFEVRLPARPDAVIAAAQDRRITATRRRRLARQLRTVLIVEDNRDAREMIETLCRAWGYRVAVAEDGIKGLHQITDLRPDVALVDIGLPGIDGYEVARRARADARANGVRLVALTGYGLPEQRQKALDAGFDLHLVKPVEAELLASLLDNPEKAIAKLKEAPRTLHASG